MSNSKNKKSEDLRKENELKKLKLSAEYGAAFSGDSDLLPPEIENQWLKNIEEFEEEYQKRKTTNVLERLGNPNVLPVDLIPAEALNKELNKLMDSLKAHGIALDTICKVDDKELYRFITEELFQEEMDDIAIEGYTHYFIYEEFHPNDQYDIEHSIDDFFKTLLGKDFFDHPGMHIADKCKDKTGKIISKKDYLQKLVDFNKAFDRFEYDKVDDIKIEISNNKSQAKVTFNICFNGFSNKQKLGFEGNAILHLEKNEFEFWVINQIKMPGLEI